MRQLSYAFLILAGCVVPASASQAEIQVIQDLQFGGLVVGPAGGSVALTADGTLIPEGGGVLGTAKPPCAVGRFRLQGPPNAPFSVKVDPAFPVLNRPGGGSVRIVQFFGAPERFEGRFDASGQAEFRLGGRLDIAAHTVPGLHVASQVKLQLNVAANGVGTVQKSFTISALLRAPLTLSNTEPLDFGSLVPGAAPGVFEVLPGGGFRTLGTGGPTLVKGVPKPAAFVIQGPAGSSYSLRLPQGTTLTGPGGAMKVQGFTSDVPLSGTLGGASTPFHVGGQLLVNPDQPYGQYRGTFTVEVCYP
jgi:hypothetical protein